LGIFNAAFTFLPFLSLIIPTFFAWIASLPTQITASMEWFAEDNHDLVLTMQRLAFACLPLPATVVTLAAILR